MCEQSGRHAVIKQRDIIFHSLHPEPNPARSAALLLNEVHGIQHVEAPTDTRLMVRYDLRHITLAEIETTLAGAGFHLDNALLIKLKRALHYYTEETERANLGCPPCQDKTTREIFIKQYRNRAHGCRDPRPSHWRNYL